jgi:hypothetical protein
MVSSIHLKYTWSETDFIVGQTNVLHETKWNANLMQRGNFIDVFLVWHVSGTYAHHQEH